MQLEELKAELDFIGATGNPESAVERLTELLEAIHTAHLNNNRPAPGATVVGDQGIRELLLWLVEYQTDWIEYGGSITYCWLTENGNAARLALRKLISEDGLGYLFEDL